MDKLEQKIEQLPHRIRRLEMESLPSFLPVQELRELMDELELEPAPIHCEQRRSMLKGEDIMTVLRELGYTCRKGDDFICVETEGDCLKSHRPRLL